MDDFKIRRGLSTVLFSSPGVINPRLVIEEGCWYLCTDTAELFLGVFEDNKLTLRRINGTSGAQNFAGLLMALEEKIAKLEDTELFQKIEVESDLPTDFEAEDFNPNITYYIPLVDGKVKTYIFDKDAQSYMCTNSIDEVVVRAMISDALEFALDKTLTTKVPDIVRQTMEGTILYGGSAIY